jgi:hypothetical protein
MIRTVDQGSLKVWGPDGFGLSFQCLPALPAVHDFLKYILHSLIVRAGGVSCWKHQQISVVGGRSLAPAVSVPILILMWSAVLHSEFALEVREDSRQCSVCLEGEGMMKNQYERRHRL